MHVRNISLTDFLLKHFRLYKFYSFFPSLKKNPNFLSIMQNVGLQKQIRRCLIQNHRYNASYLLTYINNRNILSNVSFASSKACFSAAKLCLGTMLLSCNNNRVETNNSQVFVRVFLKYIVKNIQYEIIINLFIKGTCKLLKGALFQDVDHLQIYRCFG